MATLHQNNYHVLHLVKPSVIYRPTTCTSHTLHTEPPSQAFTYLVCAFCVSANVGRVRLAYQATHKNQRAGVVKGKGKAVPLQARRGPEGSRNLRFPDFMTMAQDGGRLSALRTGRL